MGIKVSALMVVVLHLLLLSLLGSKDKIEVKSIIMTKIKNIVFDLGGVLIDLSHDQAVRRFEEIGVVDAAQLLDPYEQKVFFWK